MERKAVRAETQSKQDLILRALGATLGSCILETGLWLRDEGWVGEGKAGACLGNQAEVAVIIRAGTRKQDPEQSLGRGETFDKAVRIKTVWQRFRKRNLHRW